MKKVLKQIFPSFQMNISKFSSQNVIEFESTSSYRNLVISNLVLCIIFLLGFIYIKQHCWDSFKCQLMVCLPLLFYIPILVRNFNYFTKPDLFPKKVIVSKDGISITSNNNSNYNIGQLEKFRFLDIGNRIQIFDTNNTGPILNIEISSESFKQNLFQEIRTILGLQINELTRFDNVIAYQNLNNEDWLSGLIKKNKLNGNDYFEPIDNGELIKSKLVIKESDSIIEYRSKLKLMKSIPLDSWKYLETELSTISPQGIEHVIGKIVHKGEYGKRETVFRIESKATHYPINQASSIRYDLNRIVETIEESADNKR